MKKIFLDKNDSPAEAVEKMIAAAGENEDIVLVIPRGAKVKSSVSNFHLLAREAKAAAKRLTIESVDEEILALAKAAKILAVHPLLSAPASRSLSDIVIPPAEKGHKLKVSPSHRHPHRERLLHPQASEEQEEGESELAVHHPRISSRRRRKHRLLLLVAVIVLGVGTAVWVTGTFFARARVVIDLAEIEWQKEVAVVATKTAAALNAAKGVLPAEVFQEKKNITQFFPATGKANIAEKARGRLVIYNAYSSEPQILVATTRFETPDGKIFRLDNQVVVPGAQVKDGKIVPSKLETGVTADKPGKEYNVGPTEKLTLPGFKGTPRFQGFYGALPQGASGGFVGERPVPTEADIAAAKDKVSAILKTSLESGVLSTRPAEFKILPGASEVKIVRLTPNRVANEQGNFSVIGEAELQAVAFRESDLKAMLLEIARQDYPDTEFRELELEYNAIRPLYAAGEVRFSVRASGKLVPLFSIEDFRSQLAGKNLDSARQMVLKLPRLASAKISVWPFWLRRLPANPQKISVAVE